MQRVLAVVCLSFLFCFANPAQEKNAAIPRSAAAASEAPETLANGAGEPAGKLPVRRVVLYKNGVGYFEHLGRVRGSHLPVTSLIGGDV